MRRFCLLSLVAIFALGACSPGATSHDKAYYAAHDAERSAEIAACQNDPGKLSATPNCINAQSVESDIHTKHFYDAHQPASRVAKPGSL